VSSGGEPPATGFDVPWPTDAVTTLCDADDRIKRVASDSEFARRIVASVGERECRHILYAARMDDWIMAQTQSYDAARKCVEQLLLTEGWQVAAAPGAHLAVAEVVSAWLRDAPDPGPRVAKSFAASVKARQAHEYPDPNDPGRTDKELRGMTLDNVRLVNLARAVLGLGPRPDLIPTEDNVSGFDPDVGSQR
jgi:hypothetical protein